MTGSVDDLVSDQALSFASLQDRKERLQSDQWPQLPGRAGVFLPLTRDVVACGVWPVACSL